MTTVTTHNDLRLTNNLIICGTLAGPLYTILALLQLGIRPGFDITRHALSLLANGELGWIQILNFLVTGSLLVAGAVGMKRALRSGLGSRWAPRMLGLYGLGMIGAGIFSADPALGFPPGTPLENNPISWPGIMHFVVGTIGFVGLISACVIMARRHRSLQQPGKGWHALLTGILFLAAFVGIASGSKGPFSLYFAFAVLLSFLWIVIELAYLKRNLADNQQ